MAQASDGGRFINEDGRGQALLVSHRDNLGLFNKRTTVIVWDDYNWSCCKYPEEVIAIVDREQTRAINKRYEAAYIPAGNINGET